MNEIRVVTPKGRRKKIAKIALDMGIPGNYASLPFTYMALTKKKNSSAWK